jgi:hypothetical protein
MDRPDRIDITPEIFAIRLHRHYVLKFPFDRAANDRVRRAIGAHFCAASGGWCLDAHRADLVRRVLEDVAGILEPQHRATAEAAAHMAVEIVAKIDNEVPEVDTDPEPAMP